MFCEQYLLYIFHKNNINKKDLFFLMNKEVGMLLKERANTSGVGISRVLYRIFREGGGILFGAYIIYQS